MICEPNSPHGKMEEYAIDACKAIGNGEYMLSLTIGLILAVAISFFFIKAYQPRLTLKTRWPVRLASSARRHLDLNPNSEIICILN
ncbi:MAG: hypothetical protein M2R45_03771 [Verrucomicrobia subdivision 3 bacterium]|nr:hypothetical protein [Limisphaerales bacterium]MCS1416788.1 hypothetical protein [Limisphaerales bacterium]